MTSSKNRAAYFRDGIIAPAGGSGVKAVAALGDECIEKIVVQGRSFFEIKPLQD
jgi:hypothetical protein